MQPVTDPASRRSFLRIVSAAGIGLAAVSAMADDGGDATNSKPPTNFPKDLDAQFGKFPGKNSDQRVLNFALTLEILEADLYRQALNLASGRKLTDALKSDPDSYTRKVGGGGLSNGARDAGYLYLKQFTYIEAAHRDFLTAALKGMGSPTVSRNPGGYKFAGKVDDNIKDILTALLPLEETGVRAYLGALPYIKNGGIAQVAGTIYSTEARHSAVVAYALGKDPGPVPMKGDQKVVGTYPSPNTFEYFLKPSAVVKAIKPLFA